MKDKLRYNNLLFIYGNVSHNLKRQSNINQLPLPIIMHNVAMFDHVQAKRFFSNFMIVLNTRGKRSFNFQVQY